MDLISRQAAIDAIDRLDIPEDMCVFEILSHIELEIGTLPSVQPERLTDDDFETIRIHLQAHMEDLCNQHRWKEAKEYQRIIDRFMAFASHNKQSERMTNRQWVDFLSDQFDISRTSAKEMLHGMMRWKKEDNFKKLFNGGLK